MYLVKSNGNYHIVISDIDVSISPLQSVEIEDNVFENSSHAKDLLDNKFIVAEKVTKLPKVEEKKKTEVKKEKAEVFVARETKKVEEVENVFVAEVKEAKTKAKAEVGAEQEVITKEEVSKEETKAEVKPVAKKTEVKKAEPIKEEAKVEATEEEKTTKKTVTRRNTRAKK
ncbi:gp158 [Bacillus phage G]|uniref:Gp158 n=1 Tax=Bacillus phage G TaxID=2884420 RepID=G3MBM4_9CAUD|nr:gp158 [Bacillus phage G]AEO93418.1 gp158 [Bacillus phage G]